MLEELGLGEASSPEEADVLVFNTCTIREKPDTRLAAHLGDAKVLKERDPGPRHRGRRLLRGGAARADLRALPVRRRRVRARLDPAPRRVARRRRRRRRAFELRDRRRATLRRDAADAPRAPLPGVGAGLDGLQLEVRVLHRPRGARPRGQPPAGRDRRRGDAARARRRQARSRCSARTSTRGAATCGPTSTPSSASCSAPATPSRGSSASASRARTPRTSASR